MADRWNDADLDAMRQLGDPHADLVARAVYDAGQIDAINHLFRTLVANDEPPPRELSPIVRDYFATGARLPEWADRQKILEAQRLFLRYAPLVTVALNCASLPGSYLAAKGARVIQRTGRLSRDPRRRVVETAQMVFDVMEPGGLSPQGHGIRTAQKVRLMHAAIRHLLLFNEREPWDLAELGMPINQEDMAGVMLTFSAAVTESLQKLGVTLTDRECESYLHVWKVVAHLLGLRPELLPEDYADAIRLGDAIERRHFRASLEGQELTVDLTKMLEEAIPGELLDGVPSAMMRFLLEDDRADLLEIAPASAFSLLIEIATRLVRAGDELVDRSHALQTVAERFGLALLRTLLRAERGPRRVTFRLPKALRERLGPNDEPSGPAPSLLARGIALAGEIPFPRLVGRSFALRAPYEWLQFATRFKDDDGVVGARFFQELAQRVDARHEGRGTDTGLMDDFDALRSEDFEPYAVSDVIRRFYEHTTEFDLGLEVDWSPLFYPIGLLYREWVARRIRTFDFPTGVVEDLDSWIELIDIDRDGKTDIRAWVRVHGNGRYPMWVGAYKVYRSTIDGREAAYISVSFPVPGGNLTTVLRPENLEGDGLRLSTHNPGKSEAGLYQLLPRSDSFTMFPAYGLHEVFELRPTPGGEEIRVHHRSTWFGLRMFDMHYEIRRKRPRDTKNVRDFCREIRRTRSA